MSKNTMPNCMLSNDFYINLIQRLSLFDSIERTKSKFFKTDLCIYFMNKGFCLDGDRCKFAHGVKELKNKPLDINNSNFNEFYFSYYKTRICRNFRINGSCLMGKRCKYAHGINELKKLELYRIPRTDNSRRLDNQYFIEKENLQIQMQMLSFFKALEVIEKKFDNLLRNIKI
ncbi:unnamed protein product [Brachionus calyciflorus]|uniref:C3H1-type domain-containing protein n=1 Tax=Brachionus calyciflorus TaxID=104777 RepID=A0A813UVC3_9BILA|nr:unnamed protein product [Brachionus calyciflorus]